MFFCAQFEKLRKKGSFEIWSNKHIRLLGNLPFNPGHASSHIYSFPCYCFLIIWDIVISPVHNTALWGFQCIYFPWGIWNRCFRVRPIQSWFLTYITYCLHKFGQGHHFSASDHTDLRRQNCLSLGFILFDSLLTQSNYSIHHYLRSLRLNEILWSLSHSAYIDRERALDLKQVVFFLRLTMVTRTIWRVQIKIK